MLTYTRKIIKDGIMTGTDVLTSISMNIGMMVFASVQLVWTGTPTGVIKLQGSNDENTWTDLVELNTKIIQPAGSAGDLLIDLNQLSFKFLRVKYTNASGSGVLNIEAHNKGTTNG